MNKLKNGKRKIKEKDSMEIGVTRHERAHRTEASTNVTRDPYQTKPNRETINMKETLKEESIKHMNV